MRKYLSLLLSAVLLLGCALSANALTTPSSRLEEAQRFEISMGTHGLLNGDTVFMGSKHYDETQTRPAIDFPISWRILDNSKTNNLNGGLFMLSLFSLETTEFSPATTSSNDWKQSAAKQWCQNLYENSFNDFEKNAIPSVTKTDRIKYSSQDTDYDTNTDILNGDRVFFLSTEEWEEYLDTRLDSMTPELTSGEYMAWWLRTPSFYTTPLGYTNNVFRVSHDGLLSQYDAASSCAARPALNVSDESILLTSPATNGKDVPVGEFTKNKSYNSDDYKLTLIDNNRSFSASLSSNTFVSGSEIEITYSALSISEENEYISATITDASGDVLYYAHLAENSESGTVKIALPSVLSEGNYDLHVFSEKILDNYKSDIASKPVVLPFAIQNTKNISFSVDGVISQSLSVSYSQDTYQIDAQFIPQKDGYTFTCWTQNEDGSGDKYYPGDTVTLPGSDVTFYALFELNEEDDPTNTDGTLDSDDTTDTLSDTEVNSDTETSSDTESDTENPSVLYGDVNCDGVVNMQDVTALQRVLAELATFESFGSSSEINSNVNGDENVNMMDVTTIQKYLADLITNLGPTEG